jgi:enoyl-CoA hydratase
MINLEFSDHVCVVTMSYGKVNALDIEFCETFIAKLDQLAAKPAANCLVLTGSGRVFSAGVDLKRLVREDTLYAVNFYHAIRRLFRAIFTFPKPVIAAISGHALAGGCVMASACDYRILARGARIGMPELRVGLALPPEGLEIFRFAAASQYLQRIVTSGVSFSDELALQSGLADELCEPSQLHARALEIAEQYALISPSVFAITKQQIRQPVLDRIESNAAAFNAAIEASWCDPEILTNVAAYVRERL